MSLFVAVAVPDAARAAVRAALPPVRAAAPHLRFTAEGSWHITLVFLGRRFPEPLTRPREALAPLREALGMVCAQQEAFEVALDGRAATFGQRVLWAAFVPCPPLSALADEARTASAAVLSAAGVALELPEAFRAHLTLARAPRRGPVVPRAAVEAYAGPRASWRVQDVQLLSSRGRAGGGRYTLEGQWPLG